MIFFFNKLSVTFDCVVIVGQPWKRGSFYLIAILDNLNELVRSYFIPTEIEISFWFSMPFLYRAVSRKVVLHVLKT